MSDGNTLSVVALSVALVALVVALGQLLGQYFATADGYRRCQSSVMGPWARYTRLSWRWRQFRFETYFTTPQIIFLPDGHEYQSRLRDSASSTPSMLMISDGEGVPQSIRDLFILNRDGRKDEEVVCWLSLLQSLYLNRWRLEQFGCYKRSVTPRDMVLLNVYIWSSRSHFSRTLTLPLVIYYGFSPPTAIWHTSSA